MVNVKKKKTKKENKKQSRALKDSLEKTYDNKLYDTIAILKNDILKLHYREKASEKNIKDSNSNIAFIFMVRLFSIIITTMLMVFYEEMFLFWVLLILTCILGIIEFVLMFRFVRRYL